MLDLNTYSTLLLWISFVLCLAITVGGILVIFRVGQVKQLVALPFLQYFLVLLYVFGYYSLWSKVLFSLFLDIENINNLVSIVALMGIPFFIISLIMLLIWACKTQEKSAKWIISVTLASTLIAILSFLTWGWTVADPIRAAYSLAGFIIELVVLTIVTAGNRQVIQQKWRNILIVLFSGASLIHLSYFTTLTQYEHYEITFIFLFFFLNTAATVIYLYTAEVEKAVQSFDDFIAKYGISKREVDIMQGIYEGNTNQEIANQLFITLQTVKDHSSRIYQKTHVKNRGQLATLLRDESRLFEKP